MRYDPRTDRATAPDYTVPALIMLGVNLFLGLAVLWFNHGLAMPVALAALLYLALTWWERRA
ncbi:hypothetical protein [Chachezhania antarctica]|uniref:hypothetical protein n=1 Tax=Chachezhania antarctica TaxID=2340860 RepID=UPI000EB1DDE8|nr:hypothetical protein [Chachezhania antarctica]